METNNIEFGILLCNELADNERNGITYKEAKAYSTLLDVIELERRRDDEEEGESSHHDPVGYDELLQAIRAVIWSNVVLNRGAGGPKIGLGRESSVTNGRVQNDGSEGDGQIEAELAGFEKLMTDVMMFKDTTSTWSKNERLAYAEKLACKKSKRIEKE